LIEVLLDNSHDELVEIFSPVDIKINLAGLVRDTVSAFCSKHHLTAVHVVVDAVLR